MPFKSEKQRRFLWAKHPDIARRWADKYPQKGKLPMYADSKEKEANVFNLRHLVNNIKNPLLLNMHQKTAAVLKVADSKQEYVDIPKSEKPTYAGEEREKGLISGGEIDSTPESGQNDTKKRKNAINELLQKISAVLAPALMQRMEDDKARAEGRMPLRLPRNLGIKKYPVASPGIPLPMGMQPQPAQPPAQQPAQAASGKPATSAPPVGKGGNPMANPIQSFGAISSNGNLNGNAAFGAKNSPLSSKSAHVALRIYHRHTHDR